MYKLEVYKTWALVLQLGIAMVVPVILLIAISYLLEKHMGINLMLIFVLLGVIVGIRNCYVLLKNYVASMPKHGESELMKRHIKSFVDKKVQ